MIDDLAGFWNNIVYKRESDECMTDEYGAMKFCSGVLGLAST